MSVKKYCYCENNCRYETLDKEEILAAIANAINTGTVGDCDTGFITTIKTITGAPLKFFVGSQSEYEALTDEQKQNLFAIITNDTTKESLLNVVEELQQNYTELLNKHNDLYEGLESGEVVVEKANNAKRATLADELPHHRYINYVNLYGTDGSSSSEYSFYIVFISDYEETNKTYSNFKKAFIKSVPTNIFLPISGIHASTRFHAIFHNGTKIYAREMYWNGTGAAEEFNYEFDTDVIFSELNNSWQTQKLF